MFCFPKSRINENSGNLLFRGKKMVFTFGTIATLTFIIRCVCFYLHSLFSLLATCLLREGDTEACHLRAMSKTRKIGKRGAEYGEGWQGVVSMYSSAKIMWSSCIHRNTKRDKWISLYCLTGSVVEDEAKRKREESLLSPFSSGQTFPLFAE